MSLPSIYYSNLLALGVLSGTNDDLAYPVRRVADADISLPWPVISGTSLTTIQAEVNVTVPVADTRDAFVLPKGEGLSGFTFSVQSEDVGGGNNAFHGSYTATDDEPILLQLTGVTTPRRVWRVLVSGVTSGIGTPIVYEAMLATRLDFPRRPAIGVERTIIQQTQRLPIPGGAPFRFRLGQELNRVKYALEVQESLVSGFENFVRENDGGEPFWFVDDQDESYWAEAPESEFVFDDQAGVYFFPILIQEIPDE